MNRVAKRTISFFLAIICIAGLALGSAGYTASAASPVTSIGLAEHGLKAYNDGWLYVYGNKGQIYNGKRSSDCSGLIQAYFTDNGQSGPGGRVTLQVATSVQSGSLSNGIPRIHGLIVTISNNDHVGIYIGNGEAVDNSEPGVNMLKGPIYNSNGSTRRGWIMWHMMGCLTYPTNGFYNFNGNVYHYTNRQYDINTSVTHNGVTYNIGSEGIVRDSSGKAVSTSAGLPNDGYASAQPVNLDGNGNGSGIIPDGTKATVTGNAVNLRSEPTTKSSAKTTLYKGATVYVTDTVTGEVITDSGNSSDKWYKLNTASGMSGYMSSLFIDYNGNVTEPTPDPTPTPTPEPVPEINVSTPVISYASGKVTISCNTSDAAIYYTTDASEPSESNGSIYTGAISHSRSVTYKAIAVHGSKTSNVSSMTIFSNGVFFKDVTSDKWYFDSIEQAVLNGIFKGNSNNSFSPNSYIRRADFVVALANLAKADLSKYTNGSTFSDVPLGEYYTEAVAWAEDNGYIGGFDDGTFKPGNQITREQMCKIFVSYTGHTRSDSSVLFDDHDSISSWAHDAVYACRDNGIVSGVNANSFAPKNNTTRAQVATIMVNAL